MVDFSPLDNTNGQKINRCALPSEVDMRGKADIMLASPAVTNGLETIN